MSSHRNPLPSPFSVVARPGILRGFVLLAVLLTVGCASVPPASQVCRSVELDTGPAWMAGAAWDEDGERLVLVDPGTETLLVYEPGREAGGRLVRRVSHERLEALDFHHPVRIEARDDGFLVGDRNELLWLDGAFEEARPAFDGIDSVNGVHFGDWTRPGKAIVAFADLEVDDETWKRGFVRLGPGDSYTLLEEMPLEVGGEYERYYSYGLRPYVASVGRRAYVLRYQEPTALYRVGRSGLDLLWKIDDAASRAEGASPGKEKLFGWDGGLYLLERVERPEVEEGGLEAPMPIGPSEEPEIDEKDIPSAAAREALRAAFSSGQVVTKSRSDWYLSRLDTKRGGRQWRRRLISGLEGGLTVVPGRRTWALIGHDGVPTGEDKGRTVVHWAEASRFRNGGPGIDICPAEKTGFAVRQ